LATRVESIVDTTRDIHFDSKFDFDFASSLLLDLAQERSLEGLVEKWVVAAMTHHEIARTEVGLIEKGDLCSYSSNGGRTTCAFLA